MQAVIGAIQHFGLQKCGYFKLNNLIVAGNKPATINFMKLKILLFIIFKLFVIITYCQQPFCADSSVRIRYIFGGEGASLFNYPDTSGKNNFTGVFSEGTNKGIALLKTDWGDSMILARKVYVNGNALFGFALADGSIITSGNWGTANNTDLLLSHLNINGTVKWMKRYRLDQNHLRYPAAVRKNILVTNYQEP